MNNLLLVDRLTRAMTTPERGVSGVVAELMLAASRQDIDLTWQAGSWQIRLRGAASADRIAVRMPKPLARAILARIATLCNERRPDSVSPYGGQGEVVPEHDLTTVIRVSFVNTPTDQSLQLTIAPAFADHEDNGSTRWSGKVSESLP